MANHYVDFMHKHMFYLLLCSFLLFVEVFTHQVNVGDNVGGQGMVQEGAMGAGRPLGGAAGKVMVGAGAPVGVGAPPRYSPVGKQTFKLADAPECVIDVKKFCDKLPSTSSNFAVMDCLQSDKRKESEVSIDCQHLLWNYKLNLTTDFRFDSAASEVCVDTLKKYPECNSELEQRSGMAIPCLIEYMNENMTDVNCRAFLKRMKTIVFSDYRLIYKFVLECKDDIGLLACGRTSTDTDSALPHNQGRTLRCLLEKFDDLTSEKCKKQVLRVAELQADDYHSDRQLYYACREDRETFCPNIKAGDGRVYRCLYRHKFAKDFSEECRNMLTIRQRIEQKDYRVNIRLFRSCQNDIRMHQCQKDMSEVAGFKFAQMSAILLCLEGAIKDDGAQLEADCQAELQDVRRNLMEDYQINPQLVRDCSKDIEQHCDGKLHRNGRTIHCLMDLARKQPKDGYASPISVQCARSLEDVLTEADVGESFDIDPVLREECEDVVRTLCTHVSPGEGRIINCLLSSFDSREMNSHPQCKESLMEVYYFISRDFRLDPRMYRFCHSDAQRLCHASDNWHHHDDKKQSMGPSASYLVLSCLFRHITHVDDDDNGVNNMRQQSQLNNNNKPVSRQCAFEVRRVMHDRARAVELDPAIEKDCLHDLSLHCSQKTGKSQEMDCLEDKFLQLSPDCKETVKKYIEEVDEDPEIDELFARACAPFWDKHCQHVLSKVENKNAENGNKDTSDDKDEDDSDEEVADSLMQCLIQLKHLPDMDEKCRAGVEHHQLITLKDYHLSHQFKQACQRDIKTYCLSNPTTEKLEVVQCLSHHVRNDTLSDAKHRITKACRRQLKFELLQRSENIKLDPELDKHCTDDIEAHCKNISPGKAAIIECLRKHQQELGKECHQVIFKREQEEARDPNIDFFLVSKCKSMIKKYCVEEMSSPASIFTCLQRYKDEDAFDKMCRKAVILREELRAKDIRLNPELQKHCANDVKNLCSVEMRELSDSKESEGKVLLCLRKEYVHKKLSSSCEDYVRDLIKESAKDFKQDVTLARDCAKEIDQHCSAQKERNVDGETDNGQVEQCLKEHVISKDITLENNKLCFHQIARLLEENKFDIQSDIALYKACVIELKDHCGDVPFGDGRKMSCLMLVYNNKRQDVADECRKKLEQRIALFQFVITQKPVESVGEFAQLMSASPSRNSLFVYLLCFIAVIFVVGLTCGRVTKRLRLELKNR